MLSIFELQTLDGLTPVALEELSGFSGVEIEESGEQSIRIRYHRDLDSLHSLRTVVAVYYLLSFEAKRPTALLGHQNLKKIFRVVQGILDSSSEGTFKAFRLSAPGDQSSVFERFRSELSDHFDLPFGEDGDLFLRVRKSEVLAEGWDVLIRTTPRPLSSRKWRVANFRGALNSTIAAAIVRWSKPAADDCFLNLMCGSGTLLIERALAGPVQELVGVDYSEKALSAAYENAVAAGVGKRVELISGDIDGLDFGRRCFDVIVCDPPWGEAMGDREENVDLYRKIFRRARAAACKGTRLFLVSQDLENMEAVIEEESGTWELEQKVRVFQGGFHPFVYELRMQDEVCG